MLLFVLKTVIKYYQNFKKISILSINGVKIEKCAHTLGIIEIYEEPSSRKTNYGTKKLDTKLLPPVPHIPNHLNDLNIGEIVYEDFVKKKQYNNAFQWPKVLFTVILGYFSSDGRIAKIYSESIENMKKYHVIGIILTARNIEYLIWVQEKVSIH
ncbi:unnamed protein product [Cunninghamella echinulata]